MRSWIVGPPGGGKTALLTRLRGYGAGADFAIGRPGAGPDLPPAPERIVYVDRAAHHRPAQAPPAGAEVWLVPEGEEALGGAFEAAFLGDELRDLGATLTLLPEVFPAAAQTPGQSWGLAGTTAGQPAAAQTPGQGAALERYIDRRLRWGVRYVELRDDLLDDAQLLAARALIPGERRLVSVRRRRLATDPRAWTVLQAAAESAALVDWPVELGTPPELGLRGPRIASLHDRLAGESLEDAIRRLEAAGKGAELLKLATPVGDLAELAHGHAWAQRNPARHQFLPSCPQGSGRWSWYRLWRGAGQRLNFVRERAASGNAPSADQPTLYEWLVRHEAPTTAGGGPPFAALLGDPVAHSRTPAEQRPYFHKYRWPVFLIAVTDADLRACAPLPLLAGLGLRAAAVTAPRKGDGRAWLAAAGGTFVPSDARDPTQVVNTLGRSASGTWLGTNTDGIGLRAGWQALCAEQPALTDARIALWGGGGTQELLRTAFPQAVAFAARTGTPRSAAVAPGWTPEVVVWAVGRSRQPSCAWPSATWRPRYVFDLNYSDDSPGREYAARCGARYESGLRFFRAQANAQRRFWDDVLK